MNQHGALLATGDGKHQLWSIITNLVISVALVIFFVVWRDTSGGALVGMIIFFLAVDVVTGIYHGVRSTNKLNVHENGVEGKGMKNFFSAGNFSLSYDQIGQVEQKTKVVIIYTSAGKYTCHAGNAAELHAVISEKMANRTSVQG